MTKLMELLTMKNIVVGLAAVVASLGALTAIFGRDQVVHWIGVAWRTFVPSVAAVAVLTVVSGCTGTPDERASKRAELRNIAIERIEAFNRLGVDPIQLQPWQLLALDTACVMVTSLVTVIDSTVEDAPENVLAACEAIMLAAAPARDSGIVPVPVAKP